MPLVPPVITATLPSSFPITSPFVVSGQHLPPRTSKWVRRTQLLSAEARTSVVRNRSGWALDARARWSVSTVRNWAAPVRQRLRWLPVLLFDVLDTALEAHHAVRDCTMIDWDDVRYF